MQRSLFATVGALAVASLAAVTFARPALAGATDVAAPAASTPAPTSAPVARPDALELGRPDVHPALAALAGGADCCPPPPCAPPAPVCGCESPWKGKVFGAFTLTSGNTDTVSAAFGGEVTWTRDPWAFKLAADFIYSSDHGDTTAERYHAILRGERKLGGGRSYVFGQVTYDRDQPAGLDYRYIPTVGVGHTFVDNGRDELKGEIGAGMTFEKRIGLAETSDPSGYVGVHYAHKWSDKRAFTANAEFFPNFNDFDLSVARLALLYEMPLAGKFNISAGLRFDYVVNPPAGRDDLDIFFLIGFSASF